MHESEIKKLLQGTLKKPKKIALSFCFNGDGYYVHTRICHWEIKVGKLIRLTKTKQNKTLLKSLYELGYLRQEKAVGGRAAMFTEQYLAVDIL